MKSHVSVLEDFFCVANSTDPDEIPLISSGSSMFAKVLVYRYLERKG